MYNAHVVVKNLLAEKLAINLDVESQTNKTLT